MRKLAHSLALAIILSAPSFAFGGDDHVNQLRAEESQRYTVKVGVQQGEILTSDVREQHGTGFIYHLGENIGIVFTNRHVVETPRRIARRIELGFFGGDESREKIPGECIFESPLHDFAVIRFDPRALKRLGGNIRAAPLPTAEEYPGLTRSGASVMAAGNPFSSDDVRTFGAISGRYPLDREGLMLQIDAAINPGNSGGPLIHVATGKVLGLNTAKNMEGDGIGYVLPIIDALSDYQLFLVNQQYAMRRRLMVGYGEMRMSTLVDGLHLDQAVKEDTIEPGFFSGYEGLLVVNAAGPQSQLRKGDIILSVNGIVTGNRIYRISQAVQRGEGDTARVRVIRDYHREVTVDEPVHLHAFPVEANEWDMISFGGFVFEEVNEEVAFLKTHGQTRVIISSILPGTHAGNRYEKFASSFLTAISVGGKRYPIHQLSDLRAALANPPETVKAAVLSVLPPQFIWDRHGGRDVPVPDSNFDGMAALSSHSIEIGVPLDVVYDDRAQFLRARNHFNFSGFVTEHRVGLTSFTGRPVGCAARIAAENG